MVQLPMPILDAGPGDVLAVCTARSLASEIIDVGEMLQGKPGVANHVVIVTHQDQAGRWMGIAGQPGGVALCDCTPCLSDRRTRTNHAQPRPDDHGQLTVFLASCAQSLGIAYDWVAIAEDALTALGVRNLAREIDPLWRWPTGHGLLPGHVVCASLAAALYGLPEVGWAHPSLGAERTCEPADWWDWADGLLWLGGAGGV
jgi:hypothetical protein